MLFSLIVMHATINQRENFKSFGWTQPYYFSPNDFQISVQNLAETCKTLSHKEKFPDQLLQYLIGTLNYGGKITDDEDQNVLDQIVKTFINHRVHTDFAPTHGANQSEDSSSSQALSAYNLCGKGQLPLLRESKKDDENFIEYFKNKFGQERSYKMPAYLQTLDDMKARITDHFPLMDMPQVFGLHDSATIKVTTDQA